jgi:hypothetical protein
MFHEYKKYILLIHKYRDLKITHVKNIYSFVSIVFSSDGAGLIILKNT